MGVRKFFSFFPLRQLLPSLLLSPGCFGLKSLQLMACCGDAQWVCRDDWLLSPAFYLLSQHVLIPQLPFCGLHITPLHPPSEAPPAAVSVHLQCPLVTSYAVVGLYTSTGYDRGSELPKSSIRVRTENITELLPVPFIYYNLKYCLWQRGAWRKLHFFLNEPRNQVSPTHKPNNRIKPKLFHASH